MGVGHVGWVAGRGAGGRRILGAEVAEREVGDAARVPPTA